MTQRGSNNEEMDEVEQELFDMGIPITRESYINACYSELPPDPWTAELEATLPQHLRKDVE